SGKLAAVLPPWCHAGGLEALLSRLDQPDLRDRLAREFRDGLPGWVNLVEAAGWDNIWIASVDNNTSYLGKSLQTIADERGSDTTAALCDVLLEEGGRPTIILRMMDEPDVLKLTSHPLV